MSRDPLHGRPLPVFGDAMADRVAFSTAAIRVLTALDVAWRTKKEALRLSSKTRCDPDRPWAFSVHSQTTTDLERGHRFGLHTKPFVHTFIDRDSGQVMAELTPAGRAAVAAIAKARR